MPLDIPTPDGLLELFRDEIVVREAEIEDEYARAVAAEGGVGWENPFPGVETRTTTDGPTLMRVAFRIVLNPGAINETDRVRHELRELWNDIRAAVPPESQVEFVSPGITHVDRPEGVEITCHTHGIVRES